MFSLLLLYCCPTLPQLVCSLFWSGNGLLQLSTMMVCSWQLTFPSFKFISFLLKSCLSLLFLRLKVSHSSTKITSKEWEQHSKWCVLYVTSERILANNKGERCLYQWLQNNSYWYCRNSLSFAKTIKVLLVTCEVNSVHFT